MSTPTDGVGITLDKPRTLRYSGRSLRAIEKETGKNVLKGEIGGNLNFTELVVLVWAGLLHEDPDLDLDDAADLVDPARIEEIADAMNEALKAAFPTEDKERGKAKAAKAKR